MLSRCFGNKSKRTPGQKFGDVESTTDQSTKQTNKQTNKRPTDQSQKQLFSACCRRRRPSLTSTDLHMFEKLMHSRQKLCKQLLKKIC